MTRSGGRRRQTASLAGRRYSRYCDGRRTALAAERGTDELVIDNPLLHIGRVGSYQCVSSFNCEDSDYCMFTPTKDKQVMRRCFITVTFKLNYCTALCQQDIGMAKHMVTQTQPHNSPWTLVFWRQRPWRNSKWVTSKYRWCRLKLAIFNQYLTVSQKWSKDGT